MKLQKHFVLIQKLRVAMQTLSNNTVDRLYSNILATLKPFHLIPFLLIGAEIKCPVTLLKRPKNPIQTSSAKQTTGLQRAYCPNVYITSYSHKWVVTTVYSNTVVTTHLGE